MTDDRNISQSLRDNPKYHIDKAQQFISKIEESMNKPGVTSKQREEMVNKQRGIYEIKRKLEKGIPLDTRSMI